MLIIDEFRLSLKLTSLILVALSLSLFTTPSSCKSSQESELTTPATTALPIITISITSESSAYYPQDDCPSDNITQLLISKFRHLFQQDEEHRERVSSVGQELQQQSLLETRKIDQTESRPGGSQQQSEQQVNGAQFATSADERIAHRRNYFKVLNKVFSRVDLPEVYKTRSLPKGSYCAQHLGCVEEIPNFPNLLKKPNVSSTYTIYTRENGGHKNSRKILFDPIVHHQLQDANTSESELYEKLKQQQQLFQQQQQQQQQSLLQQQNQQQLGSQPIVGGVQNLLGRPIQQQQQTTTTFGRRQQQTITSNSWRTAAKIVYSQEYPFDLASLEQSGFNSSLNTRIIVGGYFAKEDEEWIDEVVKQWLLLEPCNVIKVSWSEANRGLYHTAAYNSRIVARQLTLFLHYLDQMFHIDLGKFHLVGHSLGAHIAGFVGADYDGRLARITGLDPAGPIFVELNTGMRLDPGDAKFVDVVHTNGGTITKGALGLSIPSGHVDYYCNGGSIQPGCYFSSVTKSIMDPVERVACNHRRSYRYFIEITKIAIREMQEVPKREKNLPPRHSSFPHAFLFEARHDDLVKLMQPEIVIMRREISDLAPLKRRLEFHLLNPDFPSGKRGMYLFRTRSESPFFSSKQYALTIKTDTTIKRKIVLMARVDQTLIAEAELDEIPGIYTLAFVTNDPKTVNISDTATIPQLSLMWKPRSFNLLLNQQNELQLSGLELSLLDSDDDEQLVIKYGPINSQSLSSPSSLVNSGSFMKSFGIGRNELALVRNQWYKFEGRLIKSSSLTLESGVN